MFSALAVARHVAHADAAVVVMGPGIVGTTPGSASAAWRSARSSTPRTRSAASPIACLRVSFADERAAPPRPVAPHAPPRCGSPPGSGRSSRCRASATDAARRPAPRRPRTPRASTCATTWSTSTRPTRSSCSTRTACTSCRWAGPRPTTPRCSRPRPRPARSPHSASPGVTEPRRWLTASSGWSTSPRRCSTPAARCRSTSSPSASSRGTPTTSARAGGSSSATRRRCASSASRSRSRRSTASAPSRATGSSPTTTTSRLDLDRGRARRAARGRHRGAPRGRRRASTAWRKLGGLAGEGVGARDRRARGRARSSPVLFDAVGKRRLAHVRATGATARHARPLRRRAALRPLVRGRPRPRPRRAPGVPGRPHRGRRRPPGRRGAFEPPADVDAGDHGARDPLTYGDDQPGRRAGARRRAPAPRWVVDAARRRGGRRAPTTTARSRSSLPVVNRAAFRTLGPRPARPRRGARPARAARRHRRVARRDRATAAERGA